MEKEKVKELLKKYGYNTVSFQSLMQGLNYFESSNNIEGFIPYIKIDNVYLVPGDPICAEDHIYEFVHEFKNYCKLEHTSCCFLSISEKLKQKLEIMDFGNLKIGEEGIFDLTSYSFEGGQMKDIRYNIRSAKDEGVIVSHLDSPDKTTFDQMLKINQGWLNTRQVTGFSFLLGLNPTENFEDKHIFIAKYKDEIVGYLSCVPIYNRNGMYFEDLIRSKDAPRGINHLMIFEAINFLKLKGYRLATLGTSPLSNIDNTDNPEFKNINKILEYTYEHVNSFYNFKGLHEFKKSFNPSHYEEKYFSFYPNKLKITLFYAIIKAYNPTGVSGLLLSKLQKLVLNTKEPITKPLKKLNKHSQKIRAKITENLKFKNKKLKNKINLK